MAYIKVIKDEELAGGVDNTEVYPVTTSQALYRQNPDGTVPPGIKHQKLEDSLQDIESDASELHRKTEKLVVSLNNNKGGQTLEINGEANTIILQGSANIETFGDEPSSPIAPEDMQSKRITISSGSAVLYDESVVTTSYTLPSVVGTYTARFDATYNNVSKYAESSTNLNLRKYFGFADSQPTNPETLAADHFSNSVACTITIPANGTGFKHIYFAVPSGMTITKVVQPDALNAPLAIQQIGTITRTIAGTSYTYKLYQSIDEIDASVNKRLTIS